MRSLLILLTSLLPLGGMAQDEMTQLNACVENAARFCRQYPREKVYLHLDNTAYATGETLWFKAYVTGSDGKPTRLSRVLYVDLLNAAGETLHRLLCPVDSLGQAAGSFSLALPVQSGYHEVRAYTREMLNWDGGYFSRVVPVYKAWPVEENAPLPALEVPAETDFPLGHSRPLMPEYGKDVRLDFFPEGGQRAAGLPQRIAFKLTDGRGRPLADTLSVLDAAGSVVATAVPLVDGMGFLPVGSTDDKVSVAGRTFLLPAGTSDYALQATPQAGGYMLEIARNLRDDTPRILGLLVTGRQAPCYFDTLTVKAGEAVAYELDATALAPGVNSIDLFTADGTCVAHRLLWGGLPEKAPAAVRQNKAQYAAFEPIALEVESVPDATLSLSVRQADGSPGDDMAVELLLASEVRGYIHRPAQYFAPGASPALLDLLLTVQGWRANDFSTLSGRTPFTAHHPIENGVTLTGQVFHDNERSQPYADLNLLLSLYAPDGSAFSGTGTTKADGSFAFRMADGFYGDYCAFITSTDDGGKKKWSRLAFNRPQGPAPRAFDAGIFDISSPLLAPPIKRGGEAPLFAWTDTIQRFPASVQLHEASVKEKGRYRGFTGNRYTQNGGERAGMRRADLFVDIPAAVERYKDKGLGDPTVWQLLHDVLPDFEARTIPDPAELDKFYNYSEDNFSPDDINDDPAAALGLARVSQRGLPARLRNVGSVNYDINYGGRRLLVFVNNKLQVKSLASGIGSKSDAIYESMMAEDFRSAVIMTQQSDWDVFVPSALQDAAALKSEMRKNGLLNQENSTQEIPFDRNAPGWYALFLYERPDWYCRLPRKGRDRRFVQGLHRPAKFYSPQYNGIDLPTPDDRRRTLYWTPSLRTDAHGRASVILYGNAADGLTLGISLRGLTPDGQIISYER